MSIAVDIAPRLVGRLVGKMSEWRSKGYTDANWHRVGLRQNHFMLDGVESPHNWDLCHFSIFGHVDRPETAILVPRPSIDLEARECLKI